MSEVGLAESGIRSTASMEKWPPSGSRSRPKTGGLSGSGKHIQSIEAVCETSAEI